MSENLTRRERRDFMRALHERHPGFRLAVREDARVTAAQRGERSEFRSGGDAALQVLRLMWVSDAFMAHVLYRARARLMARGIPVLPRILHKLSMMSAQVSIGDPVLMHPGVYIVHGQIVLDGLVEVGAGAVLSPWITIGLRAGNVQGATVGPNVNVGTGAKIIGPVTVGAGARIGANAVVVDDVPDGVTVVGIPAKQVGNR